MDAPAKGLMFSIMALVGVLIVCVRELPSRQVQKGTHMPIHFDRKNPSKGYGTERIHEDTMQHAYDAQKSRLEKSCAPVCGVKGYSWFLFIPEFDIIKAVAVDYIHCVLLGVMKTLAAEFWSISKRVEEVDRHLLNITPPDCISRAPQSISKDFAHWKASQFCSFLFFYGIPCLWNILPDEYFQHFLLLAEAIWLLNQSSIHLSAWRKLAIC